ncbi:MAG: PadR family transcriptional regulator [Candidatus Helarchaeota archaeon]
MMYPSGYALKSPIELLILLTIKKEGEIHGFELIKKLNKFEHWEPKAGTVYPILERLKKKGYLKKVENIEKNTRIKALYSLTEKGLEVLRNNIDIIEGSMNFFEKIFEIGNDLFDNDIRIIEFIQNRFETYFKVIQIKKFDIDPDSILKLSQLSEYLTEQIEKIDKKISRLKEEGQFVKVDIK